MFDNSSVPVIVVVILRINTIKQNTMYVAFKAVKRLHQSQCKVILFFLFIFYNVVWFISFYNYEYMFLNDHTIKCLLFLTTTTEVRLKVHHINELSLAMTKQAK